MDPAAQTMGRPRETGEGGEDEGDDLGTDDWDEDDDDMSIDSWGGIPNHASADNGLSNKVESLERTLAAVTKGLRDVTRDVSLGFQTLAAATAKGQEGIRPRIADGKRRGSSRAGADDASDSDDGSVRYADGESDWDDLMARYDTTGEKEMHAISLGDILPEKLYLCIPRDSELFPEVSEDTDKLRWDQKGVYPMYLYNVTKLAKGWRLQSLICLSGSLALGL